MSARWLLSAAVVFGCDDGATPAPAGFTCTDVVLTVGASSLARCPDGARFSWRHAGREILVESSAGLRIAGVDVLGPAWPDVAWRVMGSSATITHGGRADLPDLQVDLGLSDAGLTTRLTLVADAPIVVDALIASSGGLNAPTEVVAGGARRATAEATAQPGHLIWLGDPQLAAITPRPGIVHPDGRITRDGIGALAPGATFEITARWTIGAPGAALRATEAPAPVGWGWRTGAAHGAVVDVDALVGEQAALLQAGPDPWIVVDGLWAPALGDWRPPADLIDALDDARIGLAWPAALVCPDTPLHADAPDLYVPAEGRCGRLDPDQPAARNAIARAQLALLDAGIDGLWMDDPVLAAAVDPAALATFEGPAAITQLDRVAGAPGADCRQAAVEGPFPRSAACTMALSQLDVPAAPPDSDPRAGVAQLLAHLDVPRVSPLPLTLAGPASRARQRLVLTALGGGPLLIADAPSTAPAELMAHLAPLAALDLRQVAPRFDADWPPTTWASDAALVLFNWDAAPRVMEVPADRIGHMGLFDPQPATATVEVAPNDVRVFLAP